MWMHPEGSRATGRRAAAWIGILMAAVVTGCDTGSILDVDLPGRVAEEALADADLARVLVNGVVADAECAWNEYSAAASHHSDEWIPASGNLNMRNWGQRKIRDTDNLLGKGTCDNNYGLYTPFHTARYQARDVYTRLEGFDAAKVANTRESAKAQIASARNAIASESARLDRAPGLMVSDSPVMAA